MRHRITKNRIYLAVTGFFFGLIILSAAPVHSNHSVRVMLLVWGLSGFTLSLVLLQLRFFREGDKKRDSHLFSRKKGGGSPSFYSEAPEGLKNPHFRAIWKHMEETRRLMQNKEEEKLATERKQEKIRLGMPEEEDILFMTERSPVSLPPAVLPAISALLLSIGLSGAITPVSSFLFLAPGIAGLCYLLAVKRQTKYYLTNHRVLIRNRAFPGGTPRWTAMRYTDIQTWEIIKAPVQTRLYLEGKASSLEIAGLVEEQLNRVMGILHEGGILKRGSGLEL